MPELLQQRVSAYIRRHTLIGPGDRLGVAVSGGADSVALLRLLLELRAQLGIVLSVVHFNHQIRGAEADRDQQFVSTLAKDFGLQFHSSAGDVPAYAREKQLSLETAGRELRYAYFRELCGAGATTRIATGHTLDDQAETVVARFVRGAWTRGLAGIHPRLDLLDRGKEVCGAVVRPLLQVRRPELEEYLRSLGQDWREDATNRDLKHVRNRVRHTLLPSLEADFNPGIRRLLAEAAEIARAEERYWSDTIEAVSRKVVHRDTQPAGRTHTASGRGDEIHVCLDELTKLPLAVQRRVIREALRPIQLDFQHVEQVLSLLGAPNGTELELPQAWRALRQGRCSGMRDGHHAGAELVLRCGGSSSGPSYEYVLPIPGEVTIPETGRRVFASMIPLTEAKQPAGDGQDLLNPLALGSFQVTPELRVRNWHPGDRFWPAHTKSPRKVKELLQTRHISGRERAFWPVAVNREGDLVWMSGFGVASCFLARPEVTEIAILISEVTSE